MPATLKTQYFSLPIYAPNDTANYLVTYNGTMEKIDEILQGLKTSAEDLTSTVEANGDTLQSVVTTATNNTNSILAIAAYTKLVPTKGDWVKEGSTLNAVKWNDHINLTVNITSTDGGNKDSSGVINIDTDKAMLPMFSVPGNPFGIANHSYGKGIGVFTALVGSDVGTAKAAPMEVVLATEDGSVTYVALIIGKNDENKVFSVWGNLFHNFKDLIDFYTPIE